MKIFQVSTLQALMLGYTNPVITVAELLEYGNIGLGTFNNIDGEMIVLDGVCYRAKDDGNVVVAESDRGVPFSTVCTMDTVEPIAFGKCGNVEGLKAELNNIVDAHFGLNSMHMVRIDGVFDVVDARSESAYRSMHVSLKTILQKTQKSFKFQNIKGTLVGVFFPDFMDGINASGWHFHFISEDRKNGGHVFEIVMREGRGFISKINSIELKLPDEPAFDTYSLKQASEKEIEDVEQGNSNSISNNKES
ncbi:acetolactate decarboxylase [uncultured Fibrobacter sp.]|uniref:acetolactate decarboxylase n=1 Tax=uncultured Fibrobacter sp. TaxID=261512 RepID=UPI0025F119FA|nr:acetolactate decarboxylase [uncultured Fibrobacter sp.]